MPYQVSDRALETHLYQGPGLYQNMVAGAYDSQILPLGFPQYLPATEAAMPCSKRTLAGLYRGHLQCSM